ncbi:MAG: ABC transporter substrate-binding protein [Nitrososphaerota archaeon]
MARGVSRAIAVVLAVVMLIIGIGVGVLVTPYVSPPPATITTTVPAAAAGGLSGEIPIGALLPLSGPLGKFGENNKVAVELAVADVNSFLEKIGAGWRLRVYIEDTETKPEVALEKLISLHAKGVKAIVGPMASGEILKIKEFADSNKILVISQSSTSPRVAMPGDYIYRFVPTDVYQGKIAPAYAERLGVTHIILVYLANPWGDGLAAEIKENAKKRGIEIAADLRIPEAAPDYSAEVASLVSEVNKLVGSGISPEKIMVVLITYGEAVTFFHSAREYDVLWRVKWFGSDGTAFEYGLQEDPKAAEFAATVGFSSPIAAPIGDNYINLLKRVKDRIGRTPEPYSYNSYDAIWVIALSILMTGKYDGETIKSTIPEVLKVYYGVSGYIKLDENGDRIGERYWTVSLVKTDEGYDWKPVAIYDCIADKMELL